MAAKKTEVVVKSNRLIEASYRMSLIEQQVVLYAICRSREEEKGLFADLPLTIRAQDFAKQFGIADNNAYEYLKTAMDSLFNRHMVIHDTHPESGKPRVTKTRWISQASYVDGAGVVQFIFAPAVIPYITRLGEDGGFTAYRLEKIGGMSSAHAVRLYELLVQYLSIGEREIEIAWLREVLQLTDEYKAIKDFKKRVLDLAVKQINEHSDIDVSYTQRKTGRNVTHLDFTITVKSGLKPEKPKRKAKTVVDSSFVEKNARPGESYDTAYRRLLEEQGQQRLAV